MSNDLLQPIAGPIVIFLTVAMLSVQSISHMITIYRLQTAILAFLIAGVAWDSSSEFSRIVLFCYVGLVLVFLVYGIRRIFVFATLPASRQQRYLTPWTNLLSYILSGTELGLIRFPRE
jgi:succinate dehydrogenase/fumarate reductase cytochrome b subunit